MKKFKGFISLLFVLLLVVSVVACTQPAPAPAPAPAPTPAPTPAPAPAPAPTPAPAPKPAPTPAPAPAPAPSPAPAAKPVVLSMAPGNIGAPPAKSLTESLSRMAQLIEEKTSGRVKFEIYWAQTLVPMNQVVDAVHTGIADVGCVLPQMETGKIPLDMVGQLPGYGLDYWAQGMAYWDLMNQDLLSSQYKKYNMRPFADFFVTDYYLISRIPFNSLAELEGKKISASGFCANTLTALGAVPIVMSPMEQYEGLQKGTIDGNIAPYGAIHDFKWYEVAKYLELFPFGGRVQPIVINIDAWNKISPEDQKLINSLIPDFIQFNIEAFFIEDQPYYPLTDEMLKDVQIIKPSESDVATIKEIQANMADEWAAAQEKAGLSGEKILADYRALIDKYEKISTFPYK